ECVPGRKLSLRRLPVCSDFHRAGSPVHSVDNRIQMNRDTQALQLVHEDPDQRLISALNVKRPVAFDSRFLFTTVHQPVKTHQTGVGGIETADVSGCPALGVSMIITREFTCKEIKE